MSDVPAFSPDFVFDLLRGVAALTRSDLVSRLARTVADFPRDDLAVAFNHKQIASKTWLVDCLFETLGGNHRTIWVLGGWYGVLSAILMHDPRFSIERITSIDVDPACAEVATSLNANWAAEGRFHAVTAPMEALDYGAAEPPGLVINTSCEHVVDLGAALAVMPAGTRVVLQSNNYRREPDHVSCVDSLEEFKAQAQLSAVQFEGELATKNYTRFMLIGQR